MSDIPSSPQRENDQPVTVLPRTPSRVPRMTVVCKAYHSIPGEDATQAPTVGFDRWLREIEDPYIRNSRLGTDWVKLDTGWLERYSLLILVNGYKRPPDLSHVAAEMALDAGEAVEVGIGVDDRILPILSIPPGEGYPVPVHPTLYGALWVRSLVPNGRVTVFAVPE